MKNGWVRKVILHYNPSRKEAKITRDEVLRFLRARGIEVDSSESKSLMHWGDTRIPHFRHLSGEKGVWLSTDALRLMKWKRILSKEKADMLITIGGDGSLLFYKGFYRIPIFPIGSGTSFLCAARMGNWKPALEKALKRKKIFKHPTIEASFGEHSTEPALNDICVKNPRHRMLRFQLNAGKKTYSFGADGVIFSTALGSTAYAYSAGGKEFSNEGLIEVVPVSPHRRRFRPIFVKLGSIVNIKALSRYKHDVVDVVVDGQIIYEMGLNASINIRRSKSKVALFHS